MFDDSVVGNSFALIKMGLIKSLMWKATMGFLEYIHDNSKQDFKRKFSFCYRNKGSMQNVWSTTSIENCKSTNKLKSGESFRLVKRIFNTGKVNLAALHHL